VHCSFLPTRTHVCPTQSTFDPSSRDWLQKKGGSPALHTECCCNMMRLIVCALNRRIWVDPGYSD